MSYSQDDVDLAEEARDELDDIRNCAPDVALERLKSLRGKIQNREPSELWRADDCELWRADAWLAISKVLTLLGANHSPEFPAASNEATIVMLLDANQHPDLPAAWNKATAAVHAWQISMS